MMDRELVCKQVRHMDLLTTVHYRKYGYPIRCTYENFVDRYRLLVNAVGKTFKKIFIIVDFINLCHQN